MRIATFILFFPFFLLGQGYAPARITVSTYTRIAQIAPNLRIGDRLEVNDTGVEYLITSDSLAGYTTDGIAVVNCIGKYAKMQYGEHYLLSAFNVKPTNDSVTNRVNLQRCVNYVGVTGNPNVFVDAEDTIRLLSTTSITFLHVGKSLNFVGRDTSKSIFEIYPRNTGATNLHVFQISQASNSNQLGTLTFSNTKWLLPSYTTADRSCFLYLTAGGMSLELKKCAIRGAGTKVIYFGGANTDDYLTKRVMWIEDSHLEADTTTNQAGTIIQYTGGRWENYLYCYRSKFTGATGLNGHQFYVQPWLNWIFEDCILGINHDGTAQLFQSNQTTGGTFPTWVPTRFQVFKNCVFHPGGYDAINLDKDYFPFPVIEGCNFYNTGAKTTAKNNATISNCNVFNPGGFSFSPDGGIGNINISNCTFKEAGGITVLGGNSDRNIHVNLSNCQFINAPAGNLLATQVDNTTGINVVFSLSNCVFSHTGTQSLLYLGADVAGSKAKYYFNDCVFEGEIFLNKSENTGDYQIYVNGGEWRPLGNSFWLNTSSTATVAKIEVRNMTVVGAENTPDVGVDQVTSTNKTSTRMKWFFPENEWKNLVSIPADNIPDSMNIGYGVYNVYDPANRDSITSIHMNHHAGSQYYTNTSNSYYGKYIQGVIKLRAKDPFILGTTGNINLSSQYSVADNYVIELEWDWLTEKWNCLNCN